MQQLEHEQAHTSIPTCQPVPPAAIIQPVEQDDDLEDIFLNAVAEIDTQPLVKVKHTGAATPLTPGDMLELLFLMSWACFTLFGSIYLAAAVRHTQVIVYAKSYPAAITATLDVPIRLLDPVTITRSQTAPTTGHGYQGARAATGLLTFFNGSFSPQRIPIGTVLTGSDGVKVATSAVAIVPAAQPPQFAQVRVPASAVTAGSNTNIATGDITLALTSDLLVKNLSAFNGGRDARTYRAVAPQDLQQLTRATTQQVQQTIPQAFTLRTGEGVYVTACTTTTTDDHVVGAEATTLTMNVSSTCQGIAYHLYDLTHKATAAFMTTRPGAHYHLAGRVQATIQRAAPVTVSIDGRWTYTFSTGYQESLAQKIAGATPSKARKLLLQTGVIADASIPTTLPPDRSLIDFLVVVSS